MTSSSARIDIEQELSDQLTMHKNLGQEVMVTTVDKVRICLMEHVDCLKAKQEWILPLGLLVSIIATLLAAQFNDFILKAPVWEAMFIIGAILCTAWLIKAGISAWRNRNLGGIDGIIENLKQASAVQSPSSDAESGEV